MVMNTAAVPGCGTRVSPVDLECPLPSAPPAALGIQCPLCGCVRLRVTNTVRERGIVKRYRKCRGCGRRFSTLEGGLKELSAAIPAALLR
jgi:hypothetical protein